MQTNIDTLRQRFEAAGQPQVFQYWDDLSSAERESLMAVASQIDLDELQQLSALHLGAAGAQALDLSDLSPAPFIPHPKSGGAPQPWDDARALGVEALRMNRVAVFVVAGGQGTRLGYEGPKGTFPVTPVRKASLFQVFAEKILYANKTYACDIPWFIMTSEINHAATVDFFEKNQYFGLNSERVICFRQGLMPAVSPEGKILMESKHQISMSPDGHGGSLRALVRSGAIAQMEAEERDIISYFQVDNPLVKFIDPTFIGFHVAHQSQMSSKMLPKVDAKEKVGNFCVKDGKVCVIEYSDLPDAFATETDADGKLRYVAGSIAIHILDRDFVKQAGGQGTALALPFHKAHKKIQTLDAQGNAFKPSEPNGYKFEMFVFDAIPFAANPVIIETRREDDFSPVKNPSGVDSAESAHADQLREYARWVRAAGAEIEVDATGLPAFTFEIVQSFAADERGFINAWKQLDPKPELHEGVVIGT